MSRVSSPVTSYLILSVLWLRFAGSTLCFCLLWLGAGEAAADDAGAGEALPFVADATLAGVPFLGCFLTSSLHFETNSAASFETAGSLCVRRRLMVTPILVDLRISSVAWTPDFKSFSSLRTEALGSFSWMALPIAFPRNSISFASIAMVVSVSRVRGERWEARSGGQAAQQQTMVSACWT